LLKRAKTLAREYYEATGRPLGVTGEVAEYEAARLLDIELSPVRQPGYDAIRKGPDGKAERIQIKGRALLPGSKPGQRVGKLDLTKPWDLAMLVLLDETFTTTAIYEADRTALEEALTTPGSRARNERGQLSVSKFKSVGQRIYPPGSETD
jgi:hypothetical protein